MFPSPGDLPNPGVKPRSPTLQEDSLPVEPPGKPVEAEAPILWPPDQRAESLEKTLMLRKIEGRRRRSRQITRWLNGITNSMDMILSELQEMVKVGKA